MLEKTCVSILQEFCAQNKYSPPLYEELKPERSGNSTIFKCKVQINLPTGSFEATGTGLNKKIAKQNAATDLCGEIGIKTEVPSPDTSLSDVSLCSALNDMSLDESDTFEKTPISVLNEFCAKNKITTPCYEEMLCDSSPVKKVFKCKATIRYQGEAKNAIGTGNNKKNAKQSAARSLLDLLGIKFDWTPAVDQDAVSILHHLCATHNYCAPVYEDVQVTGPAHCREFTLRCKVASVSREAKGPSKKQAKQNVAREIMKYLHEADQCERDKLKLNSCKMEFLCENDEYQNMLVNRTYRHYKSHSNKKPITSDISERHNFYVSYLSEKDLENARHEFVSGKHETLKERVIKTLETAGLDFSVTQVPSLNNQMFAFELLNDHYDCYIVAFHDELWSRVADYFVVMLNISSEVV